MDKKFILTFILIFVVSMILGFVTHGWLLMDEYNATGIFRTEAEQESMMLWMLLAHVIMAFAFVKLYVGGREDKPWLGQGLRFGFYFGLFAAVGIYMIYYVVLPMPEVLAIRQAAYDLINMMVLGAVAAWMYR